MNKYPYDVYTVQGSCNNTKSNCIYLTKWKKMHKTKYDDDPEVEGDSDDNSLMNDEEPEIVVQQIEATYDINRIRTLGNSPVVAFWNDMGKSGGEIHIMDVTVPMEKLFNNIGSKKKEKCKEIILFCP
eukprot:GHVR01173234.1.p1 GENE.GHVR01173234.1~~GHVR01173234.1.p1  ORF type:complete len:128 (-),score=13.32 GHVR01173234.1:1805-2188(-)